MFSEEKGSAPFIVTSARDIDQAFENFLGRVDQKRKDILVQNKHIILKQVLDNLALPEKDIYSTSELTQIDTELNQCIVINGRGLPNLIPNGNSLEPDSVEEEKTSKVIAARNLLRQITLGEPIPEGEERQHYARTLDMIKKGLEITRDPELLRALRSTMQDMLLNATTILQTVRVSEDDEKQFKIFLNNLLAALPFLDPDPLKDTFLIPQKMDGKWKNISYRVERIDISPQSGLLSCFVNDATRIYAYGLVPTVTLVSEKDVVNTYLLLMGTTYPTGQGIHLSELGNLHPCLSVGEAHDMTELKSWIQRNSNIIATGHSQGATAAMMVAATYPELIKEAHCLNPAGLKKDTLENLWESYIHPKRAKIFVYAQENDPVFRMENGFLPQTEIYRLVTMPQQASAYRLLIHPYFQSCYPGFLAAMVDAHLHHRAGNIDGFLAIRVNTHHENLSRRREWFADVKTILTATVLYPAKYLEIITSFMHAWAEQHYILSKLLLGAAVAGTWNILGFTVFYAKITELLIGTIEGLSLDVLVNGTIALSSLAAAGIAVIPLKQQALILWPITIAQSLTKFGATLAMLSLGCLLAGIKVGIRTCFDCRSDYQMSVDLMPTRVMDSPRSSIVSTDAIPIFNGHYHDEKSNEDDDRGDYLEDVFIEPHDSSGSPAATTVISLPGRRL